MAAQVALPMPQPPAYWANRNEPGGAGYGVQNPPYGSNQNPASIIRSLLGPPSEDRSTMHMRDVQPINNFVFPDIYRGSSQYMLNVVLDALNYVKSFALMERLAPLEPWEGFNKLVIEEHHYNPSQLDHVPEQGVSRTLTSEFRSWTRYPKRYGHAIRMEKTFYQTARGQQDFYNQMATIVVAVRDTIAKNTLYALLTAPIDMSTPSGVNWHSKGFVNTVAGNIAACLDRELFMFNIFGRNSDTNILRSLFAAVTNGYEAQGVEKGPATILVATGLKDMFTLHPVDYSSYAKNGPAGFQMGHNDTYLSSEAQREGYAIEEVGNFLLALNRAPECPLLFNRSVGMHTVVSSSRLSGQPNATQGGELLLNPIIFDFKRDTPVQIKYEELLVASGVFDHEGKYSPLLGDAYFQGCNSLFQWANLRNAWGSEGQVYKVVNDADGHELRAPLHAILDTGVPRRNLGAHVQEVALNVDDYKFGEFDNTHGWTREMKTEEARGGESSLKATVALATWTDYEKELKEIATDHQSLVPMFSNAYRALSLQITTAPIDAATGEPRIKTAAETLLNAASYIVNKLVPAEAKANEAHQNHKNVATRDALARAKKRLAIWIKLVRCLGDPFAYRSVVRNAAGNGNDTIYIAYSTMRALHVVTQQANFSEATIQALADFLFSFCLVTAARNNTRDERNVIIGAYNAMWNANTEAAIQTAAQTHAPLLLAAANRLKAVRDTTAADVGATPADRAKAAVLSILHKPLSQVSKEDFVMLVRQRIVKEIPMLIVRPYVTFVMSTAIAVKPNSVRNWIGNADFELSSEVTQKMVEGNLTLYTNAFVMQPKGVLLLPNVSAHRYVFGGSAIAWDPHNPEHVDINRQRNEINRRPQSMFVIPLDPNESNLSHRWIDVSGAAPTGSIGSCRLMPVYANFWRFEHTEKIGPNGFFEYETFDNAFSCNEWSAVRDGKDNFRDYIPSPAWLPYRMYPGACADFCNMGAGRIRLDKQTSDVENTCMPISIFDHSNTYRQGIPSLRFI